MKCGKLLCSYDKAHVLTIPNASVLYSNVNGKICIGLDYAYGDENSAKMWIKDGTVCGERKVCGLLLPGNILISSFKCIHGIFLKLNVYLISKNKKMENFENERNFKIQNITCYLLFFDIC